MNSSRIDLHGLIQLEKVEDILSAIVNRINSQDVLIENLHNLCTSLISIQEAHESFAKLHALLGSVSKQVQEIRNLATTKVDGKIVAAGELACINYVKIQDIGNKMANFGLKLEFDNQIKALRDSSNQQFIELKKWATPIDFTYKLQDEQKDIYSRIQGIENILPSKLDRSEIKHFDSVAARLEMYADFKDNTIKDLNALKKSTKYSYEKVSQQAELLDKYYKEWKSFEIESRKFAPKTEIRAIVNKFSKEIEVLESSLVEYSKREDVSKLEKDVQSLKQTIPIHEERILSQSKYIELLNSQIVLKAESKDLTVFVKRVHFDEMISTLGSLVDTKCDNTIVQDLLKDFKVLTGRVDVDADRIDLAIRFMDWFTSRGETYEYNMKIIDKHLHGLAQGSIPDISSRQPYSGQIRFTPTR